MSEIRHAVRALFKQPLFTAIALATLALGIGANTAIFSLVHSILLKPQPYPDAERLVFIFNTYPKMGLPQASVSIPDYLDRRSQAPAVEEATLFNSLNVNLAEEGRPERVRALRVTPSFFATFQTAPAQGQAFTAAHATPGQDKVAVLTHELWVSRFARDRGLVGRDIRLDGQPYRVLGIMPERFVAPSRDIGLLVPFAFTPQQMSDNERGNEFSVMVARLRPGTTVSQLDAQMRAIVQRNLERLPGARAFAESSGFGGYAVAYHEQVVGDVRPALLVLQAGVVLVLLIACANVANLQLVRATARHKEMAIRATLGANRAQILRHLLIEGLALALCGGLLGVLLGSVGLTALTALGTSQLPRVGEVSLSLPALAFTLALALLTGIVFGLVPAMTLAPKRLVDVIKEDGGRQSAGRRTRVFRNGLVAAEVALALVLLVGAGLLMRSFARLQTIDPGFDTSNLLTALVSLPQTRYPDAPAATAFWTRALARAREIPGVTSAGLVSVLPFAGSNSQGSYRIVGYEPGPGEPQPHGQIQVVDGGFFGAMRIPLRSGRVFTPSDTADAPRVVVIDEFLAKRYFAGTDPIGRQITRGPATSPPWTIVGVVGSIRKVALSEEVRKETLYFAYTQAPFPVRTLGFALKTGLDPATLTEPLRLAIRAIDADQPIFEARTMDQRIVLSLQQRRTPMVLIGAFAALALILAVVGLYGVLAYAVSQRTRELGIRQALGAARPDILRLVLRQGLILAGAGIVFGVVASFWLVGFLETQLYGVRPRDPLVLVAVPLMLLAVAALASLLPAWRATRIEPVEALREA